MAEALGSMAALPSTSFPSFSSCLLFVAQFSFLASSTAAASDGGDEEDAALAPDSSFPPSFPILSSVSWLADSVVLSAAAAGANIVIGCGHLEGDVEEEEGDDDDKKEPDKPE